MSNEILKHNTETFNAELYVAFQNAGGVMRGRSRRKTGVIGESTNFPKIGLAGVAQPKTRNGKVPLQDIGRDRVNCPLTDYYGSTMLDDLDTLKTNVDEKTAIQNAIAMSLARSEDDIALAALMTSGNALNNLTANDTWSSDTVPRAMLRDFGKAEAMAGGSMNALVSWAAWSDLLAIPSFVNSDLGGRTELTSEGVMAKMFFGFAYAPFSRLPLSGGKPVNIFWNSGSVGVAVGKEITPETSWLSDYDSWHIKGKMSQGACLIDATGVVLRQYNS
jgi:hypothetical protein